MDVGVGGRHITNKKRFTFGANIYDRRDTRTLGNRGSLRVLGNRSTLLITDPNDLEGTVSATWIDRSGGNEYWG